MSAPTEMSPDVHSQMRSEERLAPWETKDGYVFDGPSKVVLPTIALVTMTKDRPVKVRELIASVREFVDKCIFLDTGSTKENLEAITFAAPNVEVHSEPFVNFEVSRNRLMELAKGKADWLLLLDDDMVLNFSKPAAEIKAGLSAGFGAYMLKHVPNPEYWVARLVRGDLIWRYQGVTHEYLIGGGVGNPRLEGVSIEHHYNHGPDKFNRDLRLLSADIARDPNDVRTIFYLANTLRDLGQIEAAIRFYIMRASMGGWDEEVYNSMYEAARLAKDPAAMQKAHQARPHRAEAAAWLSGYYKFVSPNQAEHLFWESIRAAIPYPANDYLFVIPFVYGPEFISRLETYK